MPMVTTPAPSNRRGNSFEIIKARLAAHYALALYLPFSMLGRSLRRQSRRLRGKAEQSQVTRLPQAPWSALFERRPIHLVETGKQDGNVNLSELAILAQAAAGTPPGSTIFEIGTFDGRTTLNFAVNAPKNVVVATLDLPSEQASALQIESSERRYVDKPHSGARLRACDAIWRAEARRAVLLFGDSATFDWTPYVAQAGLVFVDGSHSYDYARQDSATALRLVRPGGVVLWHDYGVWPGVTRALDELEARDHLGFRQVRGTSLVFWRAPAAPAG